MEDRAQTPLQGANMNVPKHQIHAEDGRDPLQAMGVANKHGSDGAVPEAPTRSAFHSAGLSKDGGTAADSLQDPIEKGAVGRTGSQRSITDVLDLSLPPSVSPQPSLSIPPLPPRATMPDLREARSGSCQQGGQEMSQLLQHASLQGRLGGDNAALDSQLLLLPESQQLLLQLEALREHQQRQQGSLRAPQLSEPVCKGYDAAPIAPLTYSPLTPSLSAVSEQQSVEVQEQEQQQQLLLQMELKHAQMSVPVQTLGSVPLQPQMSLPVLLQQLQQQQPLQQQQEQQTELEQPQVSLPVLLQQLQQQQPQQQQQQQQQQEQEQQQQQQQEQQRPQMELKQPQVSMPVFLQQLQLQQQQQQQVAHTLVGHTPGSPQQPRAGLQHPRASVPTLPASIHDPERTLPPSQHFLLLQALRNAPPLATSSGNRVHTLDSSVRSPVAPPPTALQTPLPSSADLLAASAAAADGPSYSIPASDSSSPFVRSPGHPHGAAPSKNPFAAATAAADDAPARADPTPLTAPSPFTATAAAAHSVARPTAARAACTLAAQADAASSLGLVPSKGDHEQQEQSTAARFGRQPQPQSPLIGQQVNSLTQAGGGDAVSGSGRGPSRLGAAQMAGVSGVTAAMMPQPSMEARMLEPQASGVDPIDVPSLLPDALLNSHSLDLDKDTAQAVAAMAAAVSAAVPNGLPFARTAPQGAGQPRSSTLETGRTVEANPADHQSSKLGSSGKAAAQPSQNCTVTADARAAESETATATLTTAAEPAAAAAPNVGSAAGQEHPVMAAQQQQQQADQEKLQQGLGVEQERAPSTDAPAAAGAGDAPAHIQGQDTSDGGSGGAAGDMTVAAGAGKGEGGEEKGATGPAAGVHEVQEGAQEQQQQQLLQENQGQAGRGGETARAKGVIPSLSTPSACADPGPGGSRGAGAVDIADSRAGAPAHHPATKDRPTAAAAGGAVPAASSAVPAAAAGAATTTTTAGSDVSAEGGHSGGVAGAGPQAEQGGAVAGKTAAVAAAGDAGGKNAAGAVGALHGGSGPHGEQQQGTGLERPAEETGQQPDGTAGDAGARERAAHAALRPQPDAKHAEDRGAALQVPTTSADPMDGPQRQSAGAAGGGLGAVQAANDTGPPLHPQHLERDPEAVASPPPVPIVPQAVFARAEVNQEASKPGAGGLTEALEAPAGGEAGTGQWLSSSSSNSSNKSGGGCGGSGGHGGGGDGTQGDAQQPRQQVPPAAAATEASQNGHAGGAPPWVDEDRPSPFACVDEDRPSPFAAPLSQASISSPQPSIGAEGAEAGKGIAGKTSNPQQQHRQQQHTLHAPPAPPLVPPPHAPHHIPRLNYEQQHQQREQQLQQHKSYVLSPSPSHHAPPPLLPHHQHHHLQQQPSLQPILVSHPTFPCYYAVAYDTEGELQHQHHSHQGPGLPMQLSDAPQFLYSDASISTGFGGAGVSPAHASTGVEGMGTHAQPLQDLQVQQYPPASSPGPMLVSTGLGAGGGPHGYQLEGALNAPHMHALGAQDLGYLGMGSVMMGPPANSTQPAYYVVGDGAQRVLVQVSPSGQMSTVGGGEGLLEQHIAVQQVIVQQQEQEQQLLVRMEAQQQHAQQLQVAIQEGVHDGALQQVQAEMRLQQLQAQVDELEAQVMEARQRHAAMMGRRQSPPSAPLPNAAAAAVAVSEHKASLQGLAAQGGDGGLSAAVSAGLQAAVVGSNQAHLLGQTPLPTTTAATPPTQTGAAPSVAASAPPINSPDMVLGGGLPSSQNPPLPSSSALPGEPAAAADPRGPRGRATFPGSVPPASEPTESSTASPLAPEPPSHPGLLHPDHAYHQLSSSHPFGTGSSAPGDFVSPALRTQPLSIPAPPHTTPAPTSAAPPPPPASLGAPLGGPQHPLAPPPPPTAASINPGGSSSIAHGASFPHHAASASRQPPPPPTPPSMYPLAAASSGYRAGPVPWSALHGGPSSTPYPPPPPQRGPAAPIAAAGPLAAAAVATPGGGPPLAPSAPLPYPSHFPPSGPYAPHANNAAVTSGLHSVARILSGPSHDPRMATNGVPYPPANGKHGQGPMSHNYPTYQQPYPQQQPQLLGHRGVADQPYPVWRHQGGPGQHSREVSPYRSEGGCSSSRRTSDSGGGCMEPTSPTSKLSWCHVQHSKKQMPAMSPMEVKELVKMQLQTRKPIRAPWYRGAGNVTPAPEGPQPGGGQARPNAPPPKTGTGFYIPPALAAQLGSN